MSYYGFFFIYHLTEYEITRCNVSLVDIIAFSMILVVMWSISSCYTVKDDCSPYHEDVPHLNDYPMLLQSPQWLEECIPGMWNVSNDVILTNMTPTCSKLLVGKNYQKSFFPPLLQVNVKTRRSLMSSKTFHKYFSLLKLNFVAGADISQ